MMSIEETAVVAQPGIAFVVKSFMKRIIKIAMNEMATIIKEKISKRMATIWKIHRWLPIHEAEVK